MKLRLLSLAFLLSAGASVAQQEQNTGDVVTFNSLGQKITTIQTASFHKTDALVQIGIDEEIEVPLEDRKFVSNNFEREGYTLHPDMEDPLRQDVMGTRTMRAPIVNFTGLSGSGLPPDPSGAAANGYYVQAVNTQVRISTETGGGVAGGVFNLNSLWPGSSNEGDPIVMYDRHADRWFISQFQQSPNKILIAISETNDPTGSYYAYSFNFTEFPDYPKYSIWWDGYYMTSNSGHTAVVFDRTKMLNGDQSATAQILSLPSLNVAGFRSPLPADADGDLPPNGTPCYFFNLEDNAFPGVSQDQIEIYEMTTDWNNPSNTQVVSSQQLSVDSFDSMFGFGFSNLSQPGTNQKLDAIQGVLMYRAQHMRWSGYNTIMLSHVVDLGASRAGIRWYELRDANNGSWTVHQSGTYAPGNTANRWMSSVAMDKWGNIGMGYSICDPSNNMYPSLAYTGRLASDTPGQMSYAEEIAVSGAASQTIADRFGDYAHLSLHPDGETFWYTGEYIGNDGYPRTRIFSFNIKASAGVEALGPYYANLSMVAYQSGDILNVKAEGIHNDEDIQLEIIGMNGQSVYNSGDMTPLNGEINAEVNISTYGAGVYFVRIGNKNFQTVERIVKK